MKKRICDMFGCTKLAKKGLLIFVNNKPILDRVFCDEHANELTIKSRDEI